jgi:hypothetical protein
VQEVELDFSPADVNNAERFAALLALVQALGEATGCEVVVTPENEPDSPFLRYDVARASVTCSLSG